MISFNLRPFSSFLMMGVIFFLFRAFLNFINQAKTTQIIHKRSTALERLESAEGRRMPGECRKGRECRRNYFIINLHKSKGPSGIDLVAPGSAVRHVSVVRHVTDYATGHQCILKTKSNFTLLTNEYILTVYLLF